MSREKLQGILQEDAASKFLAALSEEDRRPQYVTNGLPPSPESFTDEEIAAALAIFAPENEQS